MFETLTQRLTESFGLFRGQRELTEANIEEGLRKVRTALLEIGRASCRERVY